MTTDHFFFLLTIRSAFQRCDATSQKCTVQGMILSHSEASKQTMSRIIISCNNLVGVSIRSFSKPDSNSQGLSDNLLMMKLWDIHWVCLTCGAHRIDSVCLLVFSSKQFGRMKGSGWSIPGWKDCILHRSRLMNETDNASRFTDWWTVLSTFSHVNLWSMKLSQAAFAMFTSWSPSKNQQIDGISECIFPQKVLLFPYSTLLDLERTEGKFSLIRGKPLDTENLVDKRRSSGILDANRRCWTTTHFVVILCRQNSDFPSDSPIFAYLIRPLSRSKRFGTSEWSRCNELARISATIRGFIGDGVIKTYCMT
jgi:hypothetical protein